MENGKELVPEILLAQSKKILFVTHLAIGDFTYLQSCFYFFKKKYPHLKIDLWIDEVRRTFFFWEWKHLRNYALIDWVNGSGLFNKIYSGSYSRRRFKKLFYEVRNEEYPIVVSLCTLHSKLYARYIRAMSPSGFVVGIADKKKQKKRVFRRLTGTFDSMVKEYKHKEHVLQIYQRWFTTLFAISFPSAHCYPFITIPREWLSYAKLLFIKWGIAPKGKRFEKVVFLNVFAKNAARCWPLDHLVTLLTSLQETKDFADAFFIINVEPRFYDSVRAFLSNYCLHRVFLFTAHQNFYQLPAIISLCDLVISVETSIIHLASALQISVIALMRTKNPEWRPYYEEQSKVIFARTRKSWVEDIPPQEVIYGVLEFVALQQAKGEFGEISSL